MALSISQTNLLSLQMHIPVYVHCDINYFNFADMWIDDLDKVKIMKKCSQVE